MEAQAIPGWSGRALSSIDKAEIHEALSADWVELRGARILLTGGTGLIGRWLVEALVEAQAKCGLGGEIVVISRNPSKFVANSPHLAALPGVRLISGDVIHHPIKAPGPFSHIIHAATDASAELNARDPLRMFDTIVAGTRNILDLATSQPGCRMLFLSSGAVYGPQPWKLASVGEDFRGGPDCRDPRGTYAEGKRAAEMLCAIYARHQGVHITTARIFAVLGPLLPLDTHFAAGNFIRDAIAGRTVRVEGAGTAVRSYLYLSDLTVWLWRMLVRAEPGSVYNVGSPEAVSIADLARTTAAVLGAPGFEILGKADPGWNPGRYVPSVDAIARDLDLVPTVGLAEAIRRTAIANGWHG